MSSYGQGSLAFSPRSIPGASPVPPFPINSADNGLSVDAITGRIVLGNDIGGGLADLLSDREIEMAGFLLQLLSAGNRQLYIDPATGQYFIGDVDSGGNGSFLTIDDALNFLSFTSRGNEYLRVYAQLFGQSYIFGDVGGADNGTQLNIDDLTETILLSSNTGTGLRVNNNSQSYQFGATTFGNGTQLVMDDPTRNVQFLDGADAYLKLDSLNNFWGIGDVDNYVNPVIAAEVLGGGSIITSQYAQNPAGTLTAYQELGVVNGGVQPRFLVELAGVATNSEIRLTEDIFNVSFDVGVTNDPYLILDRTTENYAIGDYANFVKPVVGLFSQVNLDGIYLEAHNTNDGRFNIDTGGASNYPLIEAEITRAGGIATGWTMDNTNYFLRHNNGYKIWFDWASDQYMIGDCDTFPTVGINNGTHLNIDDANNVFNFKNTANNAIFNINGVNGFTGTVAAPASITVDGGIVTNVT